jgi:uncharacterized lipoprotein YajG
MKNTLIILLSGLLLCGCSKKPATLARPAADLVEAGKDITWSDGAGYVTHVMHITKRDGVSLEGIRIVDTERNGNVMTITANKGKLTTVRSVASYGIEYTNVVWVDLDDAQFHSGMTNQTIKGFSVAFHE